METEIPDYSQANLELCREALMEAVAETSEEFMDRYFAGEEFSEFEIRSALRTNVVDGSIVPVALYNTSSVFNTPELTLIREYLPINGSAMVLYM